MTSTERYNLILATVNSKYGAPMGRYSDRIEDRPTDTRVYDRKVDAYPYDKGGAYWGSAIHGIDPLRVMYTIDGTFVCFYRAWTKYVPC